MSYYIVYDDFLPPHEFGLIKSYLGPNGNFPWNLSGRINNGDTKNEDMYFGTMVYFNCDDEGFSNYSRKITNSSYNKSESKFIYN